MRVLAILFILLLLPLEALAAPAQAGSWVRCPDSTTPQSVLTPGTFLCFDGVTNADATPIFDASACENVDSYLWDDNDGASTDCTVAYTPQVCAAPPLATDTDAIRNEKCQTMEGASALAVNNGINGGPGLPWQRFIGDEAGSNATSCRIIVKCSQPSR